MKNRIIQLAVLSALIGSVPVWAGQNITVHVKGMVCDFCARGLTKSFNAFREKAVLEDFQVDLSKHTVHLNVKEGASLSDAEITTVVEGSSLAVDKIDR